MSEADQILPDDIKEIRKIVGSNLLCYQLKQNEFLRATKDIVHESTPLALLVRDFLREDAKLDGDPNYLPRISKMYHNAMKNKLWADGAIGNLHDDKLLPRISAKVEENCRDEYQAMNKVMCKVKNWTKSIRSTCAMNKPDVTKTAVIVKSEDWLEIVFTRPDGVKLRRLIRKLPGNHT